MSGMKKNPAVEKLKKYNERVRYSRTCIARPFDRKTPKSAFEYMRTKPYGMGESE